MTLQCPVGWGEAGKLYLETHDVLTWYKAEMCSKLADAILLN